MSACFDLPFAVILGRAEMQPLLAARATAGQARGWARCPPFVLPELSPSVSPAGRGVTAMLMALAMIIASLPG